MQIKLYGKYGQGKTTKTDADDFKSYGNYKWHIGMHGYVCRNVGRKTIYLHREIMKPAKGLTVDHINMDKLDNRKKNLRNVTYSVNCSNTNKRKKNSSGYKGVTFYKRDGTWKAQLKVMYRNIHLGYFKTPQEASKAYEKAHSQYFN